MNRLETHAAQNGIRLAGIRPHLSNRIFAHTSAMDALAGFRADAMPKILALRARHELLDSIGGTLDRAEKSEATHYATAHASLRGKGKADKLTPEQLEAIGYSAENWAKW